MMRLDGVSQLSEFTAGCARVPFLPLAARVSKTFHADVEELRQELGWRAQQFDRPSPNGLGFFVSK